MSASTDVSVAFRQLLVVSGSVTVLAGPLFVATRFSETLGLLTTGFGLVLFGLAFPGSRQWAVVPSLHLATEERQLVFAGAFLTSPLGWGFPGYPDLLGLMSVDPGTLITPVIGLALAGVALVRTTSIVSEADEPSSDGANGPRIEEKVLRAGRGPGVLIGVVLVAFGTIFLSRVNTIEGSHTGSAVALGLLFAGLVIFGGGTLVMTVTFLPGLANLLMGDDAALRRLLLVGGLLVLASLPTVLVDLSLASGVAQTGLLLVLLSLAVGIGSESFAILRSIIRDSSLLAP